MGALTQHTTCGAVYVQSSRLIWSHLLTRQGRSSATEHWSHRDTVSADAGRHQALQQAGLFAAHPQHPAAAGDGRLLGACGPRHTLYRRSRQPPQVKKQHGQANDANLEGRPRFWISAQPSVQQRVRLMGSAVICAVLYGAGGAAAANSEAKVKMQAPVGQDRILVGDCDDVVQKRMASHPSQREA